mgnify:CR=1 FL=1
MQLLAQISSETDLYVAQNIFFAVIAVTMIYAAFRVVTTANVSRGFNPATAWAHREGGAAPPRVVERRSEF